MNGKLGVQKEDLQKTDIICPKCEGIGTEFTGELKIPYLCHVCGGNGKLDWLERLFGKVINIDINVSSTGIICNDRRRNRL